MVGRGANRANIHYPDGTVDRGVPLLEDPEKGREVVGVNLSKEGRWVAVEIHLTSDDEQVEALCDVWVHEAGEKG
jgi:hypothetical protein